MRNMTAFFYLIFLTCLAPLLIFVQLVHKAVSGVVDLFKSNPFPRMREFVAANVTRLRHLFPRQRNSK
jgi:hypothetical protein